MILDKLLQFSSDQNVTADARSTNVIDFGSARRMANGERMWLVLVSKAAVGGTSPTLAVQVHTDDNASFSSATTKATSETLTSTTFANGTVFTMPLPDVAERYLSLYYDVGGTSPDFTVDAFLTSQEPRNWTALADGI